MTQVITGQNPRPSGNLPRSLDFNPANWGKNSPQKIHHRPVGKIHHRFFLADPSIEPEQYRTLSLDRPCRAGIRARLIPGTHARTPYTKKKTPRTSNHSRPRGFYTNYSTKSLEAVDNFSTSVVSWTRTGGRIEEINPVGSSIKVVN